MKKGKSRDTDMIWHKTTNEDKQNNTNGEKDDQQVSPKKPNVNQYSHEW